MPLKPLPEAADVVVLGSGAAALAAALAAGAQGLSVAVLEKAQVLGGTSAMSGAGTWIPANPHMLAAGVEDDAAAALDYIRAVQPLEWRNAEEPLWRRFVEEGPNMVSFLERETPIRFELLSEPDPEMEAPGARAFGRMLSTRPLKMSVAGRFSGKLRTSTQPHSLTYEEMIHADFVAHPLRAYLKTGWKILARKLRGERTMGSALIAGMLRGCLDHGVSIVTGARALSLDRDAAGAVTGVWIKHGGGRSRVGARQGVVIATGGFEWDPVQYAAHFPAELDFLCSPSTNTGDGQVMAAEAGAELARMDQANIAGALPTIYEGRVHGMPLRFQANRYAIVVDRNGRRFGDEFSFNFAERLLDRDADGAPQRLPAWVIADANALKAMPILSLYARRKRGWLVRSPTLGGLAKRIGLSEAALAATVERWNGAVDRGADEDFGRGASGFDRAVAGPEGALGRIERAPFAAMPFNVSLMGTKGGPRTDDQGRVLRPDGSVIKGLYAAGNAMANPFGTRAVGAGTTIGPALTWGYICGRSLGGAYRQEHAA